MKTEEDIRKEVRAASARIPTVAEPAPAMGSKDPAAQALGQRGGLKRAATMSPERRSAIAREAALRRWSKRLGD